MVSGLTRNQVPGNRLRVRIPCPPLRPSPLIKELPTNEGRRLFCFKLPNSRECYLKRYLGGASPGFAMSFCAVVGP